MKVLLGVGGSEDSIVALEETVERTAETDDELTIAILDNPAADETPEAVERRIRRSLTEHGVDARVRRVEGDPGAQIVEIAESEGFDRIVLGGGRRSPMGKITVGTIAEFVILNAQTTVTLVR